LPASARRPAASRGSSRRLTRRTTATRSRSPPGRSPAGPRSTRASACRARALRHPHQRRRRHTEIIAAQLRIVIPRVRACAREGHGPEALWALFGGTRIGRRGVVSGGGARQETRHEGRCRGRSACSALAAAPGAVVHGATPKLHGNNFFSNCRFSHAASDDPIVYPGQPGPSHPHTFFGNTSTDAFSTLTSLRAASTTCRPGGDTAAYWIPTLYRNGREVRPRPWAGRRQCARARLHAEPGRGQAREAADRCTPVRAPLARAERAAARPRAARVPKDALLGASTPPVISGSPRPRPPFSGPSACAGLRSRSSETPQQRFVASMAPRRAAARRAPTTTP